MRFSPKALPDPLKFARLVRVFSRVDGQIGVNMNIFIFYIHFKER